MVTPSLQEEAPGYCYPAVNAPPPGFPCIPFTPSPQQAAAAALAFCQSLATLSEQQGCIVATLGNIGGFICPIDCAAPSGGASKLPPPRPPGRHCTLPDGAMEWVVDVSPLPDGAKC